VIDEEDDPISILVVVVVVEDLNQWPNESIIKLMQKEEGRRGGEAQNMPERGSIK